jgi:hypothetical protein
LGHEFQQVGPQQSRYNLSNNEEVIKVGGHVGDLVLKFSVERIMQNILKSGGVPEGKIAQNVDNQSIQENLR